MRIVQRSPVNHSRDVEIEMNRVEVTHDQSYETGGSLDMNSHEAGDGSRDQHSDGCHGDRQPSASIFSKNATVVNYGSCIGYDIVRNFRGLIFTVDNWFVNI